MRMIPSAVVSSTSSSGERRVFDLLSATNLGDGQRAFHSLNLAEHDYKRVGELDFVVLLADAVLVLEVKSGGVACREGLWHFTDRFGAVHKRSEGPFQQARSGMFSLERRLREELGASLIEGFAFGYGVVFTDAVFPDRSVEWTDELILDASLLRGKRELRSWLQQLAAFWVRKSNRPARGRRSELDVLSSALRPDFERVPSLAHRAQQFDVVTEQLTKEQYDRLDLIGQNPRILVSGGAGTGKTFLAAEVARRHASAGQRVLFHTSTPLLRAFMTPRITHPLIAVVREGDDIVGPFDVLVVDEAQDVMSFEFLDRADAVIVGGLRDGVWRWFFDENKQQGLVGRFDAGALDMLREFGGVSATLRHNCRNTRQITTITRLLTAADLGSPRVGDGPRVRIEYFSTEADQARLIDSELARLRDQDVEMGSITILSPLPLAESSVRLTSAFSRGRVVCLDEQRAAAWPCSETTFAEVSAFKGLENRFILLADVRAMNTEGTEANVLYVGMSRARTGLWLGIDSRLESLVDELSRSNLAAVTLDRASE